MTQGRPAETSIPPANRLDPVRRAELGAALAEGRRTRAELAADFGVSGATVSRVARTGAEGPGDGPRTSVAVRLSATELGVLDALVSAAGGTGGRATRSAMLRQVLGAARGFVAPDPGLASSLVAALGQLRGSATNLNQLARAANRGAPGWGAAERSAVAALTRDIGTLSRAIADLQAAAPRPAARAAAEPRP